ncbi:MAG: sugar-binding domain-containing protein [Bacteroidota bacterium]
MRYFKVIVPLIAGLFFLRCSVPPKNWISLEGQWQVKLDSLDQGIPENWAASHFEGQPIQLPGTLDDAGIGAPNRLKPELNNYVLSNLARKHQYIGKAWYQKEVEIPGAWQGKSIRLTLERVIWESSVYVDGKRMGKAESLVSSHEYDLSKALSPGKHLLTICIDNGNKYPLINVPGTKYPDPINQDMAHAYTNHTQIKWNGIIGDLLLRAMAPDAPENLQIYPDVDDRTLRVSYQHANADPKKSRLEIADSDGRSLLSTTLEGAQKEGDMVEFKIQKPEDLQFWDEFRPHVYEARLITGSDTLTTPFGYRKIGAKEGKLTLNGDPIFLRGNLECAIFPLTGHPPMEKEGWAQLIQQAKSYGLNHLRFHSWCPPKAAFEAADEAGFYLQVELPHWSLKVGEDQSTTEFLRDEANKILRDYGNHPSFVLMALGNELQGDAGLMNAMTADLKRKDNRHLYMTTAFSFQKPMGERPEPEDEYFVTQWTDKGWIRGQGIFNNRPPHFDADYSANSEHIEIPLISHEIGQYAVYPNLSEIPKYDGVLKPLNFEAVKNDLEKKGLLDLAGAFTQASGKLAAMLYKEEIERALKTPSFDGFQLLQLQDFPGQGTALVGLLNAFWESKGAISAEEFRKFNCEMVPLIRFKKAVYETGETFKANIEIANFYEPKTNQTIKWSIKNESGDLIKEGSIEKVSLTLGNNQNLGTISYPVETGNAQRWTVEVALLGTDYKNDWPIWIYPKGVMAAPKDIVVTRSFETALMALEKGQKVLLNPDPNRIEGIEGRFVPVFWSPVHFPSQPGTMGLLIDSNHSAFRDFPTRSHTEWQWWDLCIGSKSVRLDSLGVKPLVRVIDNFVTNNHLANVFEAKVGKGKLLFSSIDLYSDLKNRPVARQLRHSLLRYMDSDAFDPSDTVEAQNIKKMQSHRNQGKFSTKDIYD